MTIELHIDVDVECPDGLLIWVVSGNRHTEQCVTTTNHCVAHVHPGIVSITVYERSTFSNVGTAVVMVADKAADGVQMVQRRLVRKPNRQNKPMVSVTYTVAAPHSVAKLDVPTPSSQCMLTQPEVTWPVDVCVGHGSPSMRPIKVDDIGCKVLAERWCSYVRFAKLLASTAATPADNCTLFCVALGLVGGCYHHEDEDDRGIAELTLCRADDCDGMAMSSAFFWNMVLMNSLQVQQHVRSGEERALLQWAITSYPCIFVAFGMSANPDNKKTFYHAWAVCEARPLCMYNSFERLTEKQRAAVAALGMTEAQWAAGEHVPCRGTAWDALDAETCAALRDLGWNELMWTATPKLHIESTSALAFGTAGTHPSAEVTKHQAALRRTKNFKKKKRRLLFSGIRQAPTEFDAYINIDALFGPFFTHTWKSPVSYPEWLKSDAMYPRRMPKCCDEHCGHDRAKMAPIILRTKHDAQNLPRPGVHVGVIPSPSTTPHELVITDWNPKHPPKATESWSPKTIALDHLNFWVVWKRPQTGFADAACSMCSGR